MSFALDGDQPPNGRRGLLGRSLASRLLRLIFGCYFVVAMVVTAAQMLVEYRSAHLRLEADIEAMQRTFGRGLADAMWSFNAGVLRGILNGIAELPVVTSIEVRDEHGRLVETAAGATRRSSGPIAFDEPLERGFDLVYTDENHKAHPVGRWTVRSNDGIALDQVMGTLVVILINSVVKTLALWGIFWLVVHRVVGRPLQEISAFVGHLDADNLGTRPLALRSRGGDELELLAKVFNAMARTLRRAFDRNAALMRELQEANATLQARVDERTSDLARLARTDQLTGLGNRRYLDEMLAKRMRASLGGATFGIILADIDHFKAINDHHGHAAGDAVLQAVAGALRKAVGAGEALGRWGGEEFMILCPGADLIKVSALAEEMRCSVERADLPIVGRRTCSFGVAEVAVAESVDDLLARADAALYVAKRNGRNRVEAATLSTGPNRRSVA